MIALLLCAVTIAIPSCKKNDAGSGTTNTQPTTTAAAITDGAWKSQGYVMWDNSLNVWVSDPVKNALPTMTLAFTADGKFTETYNGNFSGTWVQSSDKTALTMTGGSGIAGTYSMALSQPPTVILYLSYPLTGRYTIERVDFLHP